MPTSRCDGAQRCGCCRTSKRVDRKFQHDSMRPCKRELSHTIHAVGALPRWRVSVLCTFFHTPQQKHAPLRHLQLLCLWARCQSSAGTVAAAALISALPKDSMTSLTACSESPKLTLKQMRR